MLQGPCPWPLYSGNGGALSATQAAGPAAHRPHGGRKLFDGGLPAVTATSLVVAGTVHRDYRAPACGLHVLCVFFEGGGGWGSTLHSP